MINSVQSYIYSVITDREYQGKIKQEACRPDSSPLIIRFLATENWPKIKLGQIVLSEKFTTDDDGQLSIRKAPLPSGWWS